LVRKHTTHTSGKIRIIFPGTVQDVLRKDRDGRIAALEVGCLQGEEELMEINAIVAAIA
jgi:hypothetical protein